MNTIKFLNDILPLKNVLYRLALRITLNKAEAEDVVQDTMMKLWSRRETLAEVESIESFCLTICRNLAVDKTRKAERQNASMSEEEEPSLPQMADSSPNANPETLVEQRDRVTLVRQIINQLPEKQRSVMQLRDFEGKSYKEIASILNISEEQVKVNIFRARQAIKKRIIETETYGL